MLAQRKPWCDAIITDPPYGLREGRYIEGKSGPGVGDGALAKAGSAEDGFSLCYHEDYSGPELHMRLCQMIVPVVELAARILRHNGRLVYLLPVFISQKEMGLWEGTDDVEQLLPQHQSLELVSFSRQTCRGHSIARIIVVMRKRCLHPGELLDTEREKYAADLHT